MNESLKIGLVAVLSVATSSVVTFLVTKKYITNKYDDQIKEEVAEIKAHYHTLIENTKATVRSEIEKDVYENLVRSTGYGPTDEVEEESEATRVIRRGDSEELLVDLTEDDIENGIGIEPSEDYEDIKQHLIGRVKNEHPDHPFTITQHEYLEDNGYDKISLSYFVSDEILADGTDIIDDVEGTIGPDAVESFGHLDDDPNIVCVRNRAREADYEVTKVLGAYGVEVLGYDPEDVMEE